MEIKAIITTWSTKSKTPSRSQFVTDKKHCVTGRLVLWRNNLTRFQCSVVLQVFFLNHNILASTSLIPFARFPAPCSIAVCPLVKPTHMHLFSPTHARLAFLSHPYVSPFAGFPRPLLRSHLTRLIWTSACHLSAIDHFYTYNSGRQMSRDRMTVCVCIWTAVKCHVTGWQCVFVYELRSNVTWQDDSVCLYMNCGQNKHSFYTQTI